MNILTVADVSASKIIGGAERVLYEQTTRLAQRGHNVYILTRKLPNHRNNSEVINGVNEWRYPYNQTNPFAFLCNTWIYSKKIFETLHLKFGFDCINFHQPFSALGVIRSNSSKLIPKLYTCHSLSFEEFISRNRSDHRLFSKVLNKIKSRGYKKIEKDILTNSDEIVVLSKFTEYKICNTYKIPKEKIKVIPGGVDLNIFSPCPDKNRVRKRLNIPQDEVILFTVRNLVHRMGLENLIIAFNDLIKQKAKIKLVIGGEGGLKGGLVSLAKNFGIEKHIYFTGFIPENDLPLYYSMADLFVLPTKELEGFGLVTLEAMACGLPVIGTPVGGTKEILGNFDSSFLFNGTDPYSIAELILMNYHLIKNNPQRWKEISNRCRSFVEGNYSWEKNIDALEELFEKTVTN